MDVTYQKALVSAKYAVANGELVMEPLSLLPLSLSHFLTLSLSPSPRKMSQGLAEE
jgi:hypothetical protein